MLWGNPIGILLTSGTFPLHPLTLLLVGFWKTSLQTSLLQGERL
ncbi:hypothetical protein MC7420_8303 [Coleofasciculus chthonoplastes PCC 7420]|uniref:Uncharacterized protein n=1 Tax=Coleofasciculus chthonoplastes PCC 7420 TaxID=118168 RepID=B4W0Q5_9CYAN|nr:hypothetical protein MC7420_8303 [Coleofasciculus chthonoplastes PCC 7420]